MRILRVVYVLAIAVVLVLLVMAGVEAFYPAPSPPEYPDQSGAPPYGSPEYDEWWQERQQEWERLYEEYRQEAAVYHRNTFLVILPLGVLLAVGGTFLRRRLDVFGAGLTLGGIGTMILAITPGDLDNMLRFAGIAATLAVLLFVGYKVFLAFRNH
jgi:hypothetical protein